MNARITVKHFDPEELVTTGERLLGEPQMADTQLCDLPLKEEERHLVGTHLSDSQVRQAVNERTLTILRAVATDIERALIKNDAQVQNPDLVAEANTVLNTAVPDSTVPFVLDDETGEIAHEKVEGIDGGQLDAITNALAQITAETDRLLARIKESAPNYAYFFDLRLSGSSPEHTWLKDFERLMGSMEGLNEKLSVFLKKGLYAYGANTIEDTMNEYVVGSMNVTDDGTKTPEFIARAILLKNHFDHLKHRSPPAQLSENLAFHYREVIVLLCKMMAQFKFHFTDEHVDPGMVMENGQFIARSYPERLEIFLGIFKYCIIATNTAKRALLLLECREPLLKIFR